MYRLLRETRRVDTALDVFYLVDGDKYPRAAAMMSLLCARHRTSRAALMNVAGITIEREGRVCAPAALEFWLIRIDRGVRRAGWKLVEDRGMYGLQKD